MNRYLLYLVCLIAELGLTITVTAQSTGSLRRFSDEVFPRFDTLNNLTYGQAVNLKGELETLKLDIFLPEKSDTLRKRPLLIFIHGGGFQNNDKVGAFSTMVCGSMARRGYVASSINYRLGIDKSKSDTTYFEAMYRAVQDAKAAVRFFRKNAQTYGIDPDQIFVMGSSAGAKTAMHLAYLDQVEVPAWVNTKRLGTLEGSSGNPGYSSKVRGVINCWGAMINYRWIQASDAPIFNVHGMADVTVAFDSSFSYHGFRHGSTILYDHALKLGIPTGLQLFEKTGHTLDNDKEKQRAALEEISHWLVTQLVQHEPKTGPEVFKWTTDIAQLRHLDSTTKDPQNAILFSGSSYIRRWTTIGRDLAPFPIIHRGYGGAKLNDFAYFINQIMAAHRPRAAVFYVGNDIVGLPIDKTPLQVLNLVKNVTQQIRTKHPDLPIFWIQVSPNPKRWAVWDQTSEANRLIEQYCAQTPNLHYIETDFTFLGADGKPIPSLYDADTLHLNEAGYKRWAVIIRKSLMTLK
ncbi:carboxylesterase family protein [Spirosoma fluviale]|uniref:Acetyl esterase/lipase n=1 Tax=Spirosoma fluviale TaxID=1597977 RepID=A0A286FZR3_9BACT|nr:carboxylesterase family protein [Spirosoma fluviale]SOD88733.1 Acetyl esterase/lipase [Spirosoma fluviale]